MRYGGAAPAVVPARKFVSYDVVVQMGILLFHNTSPTAVASNIHDLFLWRLTNTTYDCTTTAVLFFTMPRIHTPYARVTLLYLFVLFYQSLLFSIYFVPQNTLFPVVQTTVSSDKNGIEVSRNVWKRYNRAAEPC